MSDQQPPPAPQPGRLPLDPDVIEREAPAFHASLMLLAEWVLEARQQRQREQGEQPPGDDHDCQG